MRERTAVALIDEPRCVGCARCIEACPVDAIAGAQGWMHTVIADWCTGCELCLPACPVDCIALAPAPGTWTARHAREARTRAARRKARLAAMRAPLGAGTSRKAAVAMALQRVRGKRR